MVVIFDVGLCNILSQSSNATCKGPEFYTTNCCKAGYVEKLILTNLEESLSHRIHCFELLSDWSKRFLGLGTL